jgi:hypothetical protein
LTTVMFLFIIALFSSNIGRFETHGPMFSFANALTTANDVSAMVALRTAFDNPLPSWNTSDPCARTMTFKETVARWRDFLSALLSCRECDVSCWVFFFSRNRSLICLVFRTHHIVPSSFNSVVEYSMCQWICHVEVREILFAPPSVLFFFFFFFFLK